MQKIFILILTTLILSLIMCESRESPEISFKIIKQAACRGNIDDVLSRIDMKALTISQLKDIYPHASDADIQAYLSSSKYNEDMNKVKESIKKIIAEKDNELCKFVLIDTVVNGETATLHVQERSDDPYYIFKHTYKKNGNKWLWSSVDGLINPPVNISSEELYNEFESNIISAERKFKDKPVAVKGRISKIGKDMASNVYITLGGGMLGETQCYIKESYIHKVADLKLGDAIIITGICNGKIMTPELRECVF